MKSRPPQNGGGACRYHLAAMRFGSLLSLVLLLGTSLPRLAACAEEPTASQVDREVERLSSERWQDRRDAVENLIRIGPGAEIRLRHLLEQSPVPEVRIRAQAAIRQISGMRRTRAALVTLDLKQASPADAFERLAEIEGARLPTDPPDLLAALPAQVTARFDRRPYWEVVLDLCRRLNLSVRFGEGGMKLTRAGRAKGDAIGCSGAFLFWGKLVPWSQEPAELGRSLRLEVSGEPRAEVLRVDWKVELSEAIDSDGVSLLPLAESGINLGAADSHGNGGSWTIPLRRASRADAAVKVVRGKVRLVLAEARQTLELPGVSGDRSLAGPQPVTVSTGGMTASVVRVLQTDRDYEMDVQIAVDPNQMDFEALLASMRDGLRTFDADGNELALKNVWRDGGGPMNNVRCRWGGTSGRIPGPPFKLLWQVPTTTLAITVPFELHDVQLR